MRRIGFLLFVLWASLSLGQESDAKDCTIQQDCQYIFVLATQENLIQDFVTAVTSIQVNGVQAFDVDTSRFAPLLSGDNVRESVIHKDTPSWLIPYWDNVDPTLYGFLFPLYFQSPGPTNYTNSSPDVIQQPCQALMAFVRDINSLTGQDKIQALQQLDSVRNTLNTTYGANVAYGPNPETVGGAGADSQQDRGFSGPGVTAQPQYILQQGPNVTVAVIDTGVNQGEIPSVLAGFNFVNGNNPPNDDYTYRSQDRQGNPTGTLDGHGTQVAEIATTIPIQGDFIAPRIMPVKVCANNSTPDSSGNEYGNDCQVSDIIIGVCYAFMVPRPAEHRLVINLSLGGEESVDILGLALQEAMGEGTVVVASGGNDRYTEEEEEEQGHEEKYYPAAFNINGLISVSSVDGNNEPSTFSVRASYNDVAALGEDRGGSLQYRRGTSFAAPVISGVVAAILTYYPNATPTDVEECLRTIAVNTKSLDPSLGIGVGIIDPAIVLDNLKLCSF
jgi:subtilisin family serine protease